MPSMVWNYLRVRGEYSFRGKNVVSGLELPPRARKIRRGPREENRNAGTTSAYAENTWCGILVPGRCGNYLRVRGEYEHDGDFFVNHPELPPRTRRILQLDNIPTVPLGTTSAYAENTAVSSVAAMTARNYLRVRGEYSPNPDPVWLSAELPPRTRRIRQFQQLSGLRLGTTSAYAENTQARGSTSGVVRNYLRVRGEYTIVNTHECKVLELPPRTRRIHDPGFAVGASPGTTSAYAENTLISKKAQVSVRNYLRVRGEYRTKRCRC